MDDNFYLIENVNLEKKIKSVLSHSNDLILKFFDTKISTGDKITILLDHYYYIFYYYSNIGLMRILKDNKYFELSDNLIAKYFSSLYDNKQYLSELKSVKKKIVSKPQSKIINMLNNLIENCVKQQNENIKNAINQINEYAKQIWVLIREYPVIKNTDFSQFIDPTNSEIHANNNKEILLDRNMYYYLQKKIKEPSKRKYIEKIYFSNDEKLLSILSKIILRRHLIALNLSDKNIKYKTFFEYTQKDMNGDAVENIKKTLCDLLEKINNKINTESSIIQNELKKDGYTKLVDQYDVIYYNEKFKNKQTFTVSMVFKLLEYIMKKYFSIVMQIENNTQHQKLWSDNIIIYKLTFELKVLGYVYFDIFRRNDKNKSISKPTFVSIVNSYSPKELTKLNHLPKGFICTILANYKIDQLLNIEDISSIFKEFSCVFQQIQNNYFFDNNDFKKIFTYVFDYLLFDKNVLEKLCNSLDSNNIKHFLFSRKINFFTSMKIRGINALFNHIIHNSPELIEYIYTHNNLGGKKLLDVYINIYKDIMKSNPLYNATITSINSNIVLQEIDIYAGKNYEQLISEIIAYGIYKSTIDGNGKKLINLLINNKYNIKKNINEFLKQQNIDSFMLFCTDLL